MLVHQRVLSISTAFWTSNRFEEIVDIYRVNAGALFSSVRWTWIETKYLGPPDFICRIHKILSGWWFGTCLEHYIIWTFCRSIYLVGGLEHFFIFPYIGNVIIPTVTHSIIFQRGRAKNHQPVMTFCTTFHHFSSLFQEFLRISSEFLILSDLFRFHMVSHFIRFGSQKQFHQNSDSIQRFLRLRLQGGAPQVISWFIIPLTSINYRYIYHKS